MLCNRHFVSQPDTVIRFVGKGQVYLHSHSGLQNLGLSYEPDETTGVNLQDSFLTVEPGAGSQTVLLSQLAFPEPMRQVAPIGDSGSVWVNVQQVDSGAGSSAGTAVRTVVAASGTFMNLLRAGVRRMSGYGGAGGDGGGWRPPRVYEKPLPRSRMNFNAPRIRNLTTSQGEARYGDNSYGTAITLGVLGGVIGLAGCWVVADMGHRARRRDDQRAAIAEDVHEIRKTFEDMHRLLQSSKKRSFQEDDSH